MGDRSYICKGILPEAVDLNYLWFGNEVACSHKFEDLTFLGRMKHRARSKAILCHANKKPLNSAAVSRINNEICTKAGISRLYKGVVGHLIQYKSFITS